MTREEWKTASAYLTAGIGKALTGDQHKVYFDCLNDLSFEAVMIGAKRVLMNHRWANFPSIAELRQAATATARGTITELSSAEAWEMAWKATGMIDPEVDYRRLPAVAAKLKLPPLVVRAMEVFGIQALCYGEDPVAVIRGQFMKTYEQLARCEQHVALLPAAVKSAIVGIGQQLPTKAMPVLEGIWQGGT